jgi:hypothetical protein
MTKLKFSTSDVEPATSDALPWDFADGDTVLVQWDNPANLTRAPWDCWSAEEQPRETGLSVGFIFDYPEDREIEVIPHLANIVFSDDDHELGEVVIPYSAVRLIHVLHETSVVFARHREDGEQGRTIH